MPLQISADITVDPSYGFVKAIRIVKECNPRHIVSYSEKLSIHLDSEGNVVETLNCLKNIRGIASIDIKYLFTMCIDNPRKVLKSINFSIVPQAISHRVIAYRSLDQGIVFIEKTSKRDHFIIRYTKARTLPIPPPPSIYIVYGSLPDIVDQALGIANIIQKFVNELKEILRSSGIDTSPCREELL